MVALDIVRLFHFQAFPDGETILVTLQGAGQITSTV